MSAIAPSPDGSEADEERGAWAILSTANGVGAAGLVWLVGRLASAREVVRLARRPNGVRLLVAAAARSPAEERDRGSWQLTADIAREIVEAARDGPRLLERIAKVGLRIVTIEDLAYPPRLLGLEDPPPLLLTRGDPGAMSAERAVAVVGTRYPTEAGRRLATQIGEALAQAGGVVVSGLAYGIDGTAHEAAVRHRKATVAVLGSGHARLYPAAHRDLANRIVATGGCVVSELPPDLPGTRWTFPRRNRLISGLADATVVVEAPRHSGALITADAALRQGRECFLVPGPVGARATDGALHYLRDYHGAARIVVNVPLLLADLGFDVVARPGPSPGSFAMGDTETRLADLVVAGHSTVDRLVAATGFPVATVLSALTLLEMRGLVVGAFGRYRPGEALLERVEPRRRTRS